MKLQKQVVKVIVTQRQEVTCFHLFPPTNDNLKYVSPLEKNENQDFF